MDNLVASGLVITVSTTPTRLRLDWRGKSNARRPEELLDPFFSQLVRETRAAGVEIEMHFEQMDHFNSSTITALIKLITQLREARVPLTIVYDGALKWQQLSFDGLRIFSKADGLLTIRTALMV